MRSIIGLVLSEDVLEPTIIRLKGAGITEEQISIVSNPNAINKLFECDPTCVIKNYTIWGAAIGMGVYAIYGTAAALCECNLMHFGQEYGVLAFLGSLMAGAFVGGIIGALAGIGEADKDKHLYIQGTRLGGKVIAVQVDIENAERVKDLLAMENIRGVKAL